MSATVSVGRPTVLVIHDDGDALDLLTRLFEASGFDVVTAVTGFRAQAHLEGDRPIDVVVAPWDTAHPVGGEVYRWVAPAPLRPPRPVRVRRRPRSRQSSIGWSRGAASRSRWPGPLRSCASHIAAVKRRAQLEAARDALAELDHGKPRAAARRRRARPADGDRRLPRRSAGYAVTRVESGNAAIVLLEHEDFDAIVVDWQMDDGSGADVYRWILAQQAGARRARRVPVRTARPTMPGRSRPAARCSARAGSQRADRRAAEIVRQARGEPIRR